MATTTDKRSRGRKASKASKAPKAKGTKKQPRDPNLPLARAPAREDDAETGALVEAVRGKRQYPGGKPEHVPTKETRLQVELCASFGNTHLETAAILGISKPTLEKYYAKELAEGAARVAWQLAANLYRQAMKDSPHASDVAKWLLSKRRKEQFGEEQRLVHSGPDGKPIEHRVDLTRLSDAQLADLDALLAAAAAPAP